MSVFSEKKIESLSVFRQPTLEKKGILNSSKYIFIPEERAQHNAPAAGVINSSGWCGALDDFVQLVLVMVTN